MLKTLSSKGQLVLPASYRKRMGLSSGSQIRIVEDGGRLILEPVAPRRAKFVEIEGCERPILSLAGKRPVSDDQLIDPLDDDV